MFDRSKRAELLGAYIGISVWKMGKCVTKMKEANSEITWIRNTDLTKSPRSTRLKWSKKNHEIILNICISGKLLDRMEVYCGKEECCQTTCTKFKITGKFKFWTSWEGRVQSILHNKSWFFWSQYFLSHLQECSKYISASEMVSFSPSGKAVLLK